MSNETKTKEEQQPSVNDVVARIQQLEEEKAQLESQMGEDDVAKMFALENGCDIPTAKKALAIHRAKTNMSVLNTATRINPRTSWRGINNGLSSGNQMINFNNIFKG